MRRLALLMSIAAGCGFTEPADVAPNNTNNGAPHPQGDGIAPDNDPAPDAGLPDSSPDASPPDGAHTPVASSGTFAVPASYATDDDPVALAIGDFNNDGRPDIATANNKNQGSNINTLGTVSVFLTNANGTLQTAHTFTVGYGPDGIAAGDFNRDGKLDLVTVNLAQGMGGNASLLLGNGDGTFATATPLSACCSPTAVASADVDKDGKLDLVITNFNALQVLLGNGTGGFSGPYSYTAQGSYALALGDINGDGKLDAVTEAARYPDPNEVAVLLGNGDGSLQPAVNTITTNFFDGVTLSDLDGDTKLDVITANPGNTISILRGTGTASLQTATDIPMGPATVSVATGDFNSDGKQDVAATAADGNAVYVRLGTGGGTLGASTAYMTQSGPVAIATADFNADGRTDFAIVNAGADSVSILLGLP